MANPAPKPDPRTVVAVAIGGVVGALARVYLPWPMFSAPESLTDPLPTLIVNLVGAVLLGFVTGYTVNRNWPEPVQKGITVGFLGSFTTMSALALSAALVLLGVTTAEAMFSFAALALGLFYIIVLGGFLALTTVLTVASHQFGVRLSGA